MKDHGNERHPGIRIDKIPVGAGIAGLVVAVGSMLIFLVGLPVLWYFFVPAVVLGVGIGIALRLTDRAS